MTDDPYRPLKNAFGRFATGIGVATCVDRNGKFVAITINSFTSVSLEPPLVLWCIENKASSYPAFAEADSYAVSILGAEQQPASDRFARFGSTPLSPDEVEIFETGAPLLKNRLAGFDCRITRRHAAGDHHILVGEVVHFSSRDGAPLVYFASRYVEGLETEA